MGKNLKGRELGEGLSQRKDGLYQARYTDRFGKRKVIYSGNINSLRLELKEAVRQEEVKKGIVREITLREWFSLWVDVYKVNCRNTTLISYKTIYKRIDGAFGDTLLEDLNSLALQDFFNKMASESSRRQTKTLLSSMLEKAKQEKYVSENVAKRIVIKKDIWRKKEKCVLTQQEEASFLLLARENWYYEAFVILLETGLRFGELAALTWKNVNLKKKILSVENNLVQVTEGDGTPTFRELHPPKTEQGYRTIPLTARAVNALKSQKKKILEKILSSKYQCEYEDFVFFSERLLLLRRASLSFALQKEADKLGIEHLTPHCLRHTFATRAIERGMNPKTLQAILGHSTLSMTMDLYCHVTQETLFSEMEKMERLV